MGAFFSEAARRHQRDASLLAQHGADANADQLWGLSAECALKAVLHMLEPGLFKASGVPQKPYKEHIDKLWDPFHFWLSGRQAAHLLALLPQANPFAAWTVNHRYAANADTHDDETRARHREAAQSCLQVLAAATLDGHIDRPFT